MDKLAVLIPCYNEGKTIEKVVTDCKKAIANIPNSEVYVYDNNSTDNTGELAHKAGAIVRHEYMQGKGNVIRRMFREIDAECYIMIDGDDTYPAEEIPKCMGAKKWYPSTIINILKNEKHMGDALLQKSYTADFLTKKQVKNHGEVTQVYVKDSHIGIIDKETWNAVQLEFARREEFVKEHNLKGYGYGRECNPFTSRIFCGECGSSYTRHTWKSRGIMQWQCKNHMTDGKVTCVNGFVSQSNLEVGFVKAYNMLMRRKEIMIHRWEDAIETGNALERLRAKQFLELSGQPELESYVLELAQMIIQMVIIKGSKKYEFTFMDGSRETVCV